jgi:hypothetical protein
MPAEGPFVLRSFVRLTLSIAAAIAVLVVALFVLKLFVVAALVAACAVAALFAANLFRAAGTSRSALR